MSGFEPLRRLYAYRLWYSALPGSRASPSLRIDCAPAQSLRSEAWAARSRTGSTALPLVSVSAAANEAPGASRTARINGRICIFMCSLDRVPPTSPLRLYIRTMKKLDAGLRIVLFALLTVGASAAFPEPPKLRDEALHALASPDAAMRAEGVVWVANLGAMRDARLLHERLRDESGLVRSYAEQGLWLLWTRSGDSALDREMARAGE